MSDTPGFIDQVTGEIAGDTPSEEGVAYAGHLDMRAFAESRDASATIMEYAVIDEDGGYHPDLKVGFEAIAAEMLANAGRTPETVGNDAYLALHEDTLTSILSALADRRAWSRTEEQRARNGYIGSVSLYTPPVGDRYQDRSHATAPAVCFYEIRFGTFLWSPQRRAMAVWFTPEVDEHGFPVNPGEGRNGTLYSNDKFEAGYHGIVRFFPSLWAAKAAYRDLLRAGRVAARPPAEADAEEGDFRTVMAREAELDEQQAARHSTQSKARRIIAAC